MTRPRRRAANAITRTEAAGLLGLSTAQVTRLRREGLLGTLDGYPSYSLADIENFIEDPWLTGLQAAEVLGVSHVRVTQLANAGRIPVQVSPSGRRWYRQAQLETVANARRARREGFSIG